MEIIVCQQSKLLFKRACRDKSGKVNLYQVIDDLDSLEEPSKNIDLKSLGNWKF